MDDGAVATVPSACPRFEQFLRPVERHAHAGQCSRRDGQEVGLMVGWPPGRAAAGTWHWMNHGTGRWKYSSHRAPSRARLRRMRAKAASSDRNPRARRTQDIWALRGRQHRTTYGHGRAWRERQVAGHTVRRRKTDVIRLRQASPLQSACLSPRGTQVLSFCTLCSSEDCVSVAFQSSPHEQRGSRLHRTTILVCWHPKALCAELRNVSCHCWKALGGCCVAYRERACVFHSANISGISCSAQRRCGTVCGVLQVIWEGAGS